MKNQNSLVRRLRILLLFFGLFLLTAVVTLSDAQIVHGNENRAKSISSNAQTETVEASRGIITDRNGKVLVGNKLAYSLEFSSKDFTSDDELNTAILRLVNLMQSSAVSWNDTLPVQMAAPFDLTGYDNVTGLESLLKKHKIAYTKGDSLTIDVTGAQLLSVLRNDYGVDSSLSDSDARLIVGVRYGLELSSIQDVKYTFASDVSVELISQVVDGEFKGVTAGTSSVRVYNTTHAAHILGYIGSIWSEEWNSNEETGYVGYKDKGYSMNALVGKAGVEKAFESYLKGTNGTKIITTDASGKKTGEFYSKEPQPGGTVALTLDIDLQAAAEESLERTITGMMDTDSRQRGGAAVVMGVKSGEVLALATYPTYDPTTFNRDYESLSTDDRLPLFNRATDGVYAPGSTFKLCTAVAALESGIITPTTTIRDQGVYTYYAYPQPKCWIYRQYGSTHGSINVSQAITESCNYFFYETGRLTGIETIDNYATQFGLGRSTGIETGDSKGALASPEYAKANELEWTDGQTITAAIGQSYNLFTPIQLANYVATLVGDGEHYKAHLLKNVKSYDNSSMIYAYDEGPENTVSISDSTLQAVKEGMYGVANSTLSSQFSRCIVTCGAKTGSAQVGTDIANGTFVCFAPYDDPQIAVAVVIEKGGSGAALAALKFPSACSDGRITPRRSSWRGLSSPGRITQSLSPPTAITSPVHCAHRTRRS